MLDTVVAWSVAWLRLAHRHHLLLALLLELNLETIVLVVVVVVSNTCRTCRRWQ